MELDAWIAEPMIALLSRVLTTLKRRRINSTFSRGIA
jgi:hypothetical protein